MTRQNINLTGLLIFIFLVIAIGRNIDTARAQSHEVARVDPKPASANLM